MNKMYTKKKYSQVTLDKSICRMSEQPGAQRVRRTFPPFYLNWRKGVLSKFSRPGIVVPARPDCHPA